MMIYFRSFTAEDGKPVTVAVRRYGTPSNLDVVEVTNPRTGKLNRFTGEIVAWTAVEDEGQVPEDATYGAVNAGR